jgi:hypothetical protein
MQKFVHGNWLKMNDLLLSFLSLLCDFYFFSYVQRQETP